MSKKELASARAEITELRRLFRRIFPSGNRRSPDALFTEIRRLADYAAWLEDLSSPMPARPVAASNTVNTDQETSTGTGIGGRSATQPVFPGITLSDRKRSRDLYHQGREYQQELDRLTRRIREIIDQSADWIRGHDLASTERIPTARRPRCTNCREVLATAWKHCPYCATSRPTS